MAISLVQSTSKIASGTSTIAYTSNNTAGNLLIAFCWSNDIAVPNSAFSDSQGNTWNIAKWSSTAQDQIVCYAMNCKAGANTVTMPTGGGSQTIFTIYEFSGIATSSALDVASYTDSGTSSITTTADGDLVWSSMDAFKSGSTAPVITVASGWTAGETQTYTAGASKGRGRDGWIVQTTHGSIDNSGWTLGGGTLNDSIIASFKKASSNVNGNATLTGLSLTSATGQPIAGAIPFGQALTSAQGSLFGSVTAPLTGASLTSATGQPIAGAIPFGDSLVSTAGTLTPSVGAILSGASLTSAEGSLSPTGDGNVTLTGLSLTSATGQPIAGAIPFGQSLTSAEGSLGTIASAVLSGQSLTSTEGALAAQPSAILTGASLTSTEGSITATGNASVSINGQALTSAAGTAVGGAGGNPTGQSLAMSQGNVFGYAGGYLLVQDNFAFGTFGAGSTNPTQTCSFKFPNMAGNALFCLVTYYYTSGTNSEPGTRTLTDSQGNTWTELRHSYQTGNSGTEAGGMSLWMCSSSTAGANTVTAGVSGSGKWSTVEILVSEFIGGVSWAADGGISTPFTNQEGFSSGNFTTTKNCDLVLGALSNGGTESVTAGSGYSLIPYHNSDSAWEWARQATASSTTSISFNWNFPVYGLEFGQAVSAAQAAIIFGGQPLTATQGSLFASVTVPLSGDSLTTSEGSVAGRSDASLSLTGQSLAATANSPLGEADVPINGQSLTTAAGTLTNSANGDADLTSGGQALTVTQGFVTVGQVALPNGLSLSVSQGTLSPKGDGSVSLSGQALTLAQGSVSATNAESATLTGQSLTVARGLIGSTGSANANAALTGLSLSTVEGTISPTADGNTPTVSGQSLTSATNNPTGLNTEFATPSGLPLIASAGAISAQGGANASLSGNGVFIGAADSTNFDTIAVNTSITDAALTSTAGTFSAFSDASPSITGAALTTAQGAFTAQGNSVSPAITAAALSCTAGTLTPNPQTAITGASLTSATNSVTAQSFAILVNTSLAVATGALSGTGDGNATLSGNSCTVGQGALAAQNIAVVTLTGLNAIVGRGSLATAISSAIGITGESVSTAVGSVSATGGAAAALTGQHLTATPGAFTQAGILRISKPATEVFTEDFGQETVTATEDISSGAITTAEDIAVGGFSTTTKISTGGISYTSHFGVGGFTVTQG